MTDKYILENGAPKPTDDILEWARWFERSGSERIVARETQGEVTVSTVFLGLDHNFSMTGSPLLYETMVFGGEHDSEMRRYTTVEQAKAGHREMANEVFR
jgi:hypothetical protein